MVFSGSREAVTAELILPTNQRRCRDAQSSLPIQRMCIRSIRSGRLVYTCNQKNLRSSTIGCLASRNDKVSDSILKLLLTVFYEDLFGRIQKQLFWLYDIPDCIIFESEFLSDSNGIWVLDDLKLLGSQVVDTIWFFLDGRQLFGAYMLPTSSLNNIIGVWVSRVLAGLKHLSKRRKRKQKRFPQ